MWWFDTEEDAWEHIEHVKTLEHGADLSEPQLWYKAEDVDSCILSDDDICEALEEGQRQAELVSSPAAIRCKEASERIKTCVSLNKRLAELGLSVTAKIEEEE